jgi:hypothetical protein
VPWGTACVLIGNALSTKTELGWRWCFYFALIFAVISLVGTFVFYYPPTRPQFDGDLTRWDHIKQIDYVGFVLFGAGLTSFLIGLTWAGQADHPWKGASVIAPLVIGVVTLVACFIYDFTIASRPLFPWIVLKEFRDFTVLLFVVFVAGKRSKFCGDVVTDSPGMIYYSLAALLPQSSLWLFTNDPIEIGIMGLPIGFVGVSAILISGLDFANNA